MSDATVVVPELSLRDKWDRCNLGPHVLPPDMRWGTVEVEVVPEVEEDDKKAKGKNGGKPTLNGEKRAKVTITLTGSIRHMLDRTEPIAGDIWPPAGPLEILHPNAALHGVFAVTVQSVSGFKLRRDGTFTYTWNCKSWKADTGKCGPFLLMQGSSGAEVKRWQEFLQVVADGVFGSGTKTATEEFQAERGIKVDGIVGPQTFGEAAKLGYAPPAPQPCPPGGSGKQAGVGTPKEAADALQQIADELNQHVNAIAAGNGYGGGLLGADDGPPKLPDTEADP